MQIEGHFLRANLVDLCSNYEIYYSISTAM